MANTHKKKTKTYIDDFARMYLEPSRENKPASLPVYGPGPEDLIVPRNAVGIPLIPRPKSKKGKSPLRPIEPFHVSFLETSLITSGARKEAEKAVAEAKEAKAKAYQDEMERKQVIEDMEKIDRKFAKIMHSAVADYNGGPEALHVDALRTYLRKTNTKDLQAHFESMAEVLRPSEFFHQLDKTAKIDRDFFIEHQKWRPEKRGEALTIYRILHGGDARKHGTILPESRGKGFSLPHFSKMKQSGLLKYLPLMEKGTLTTAAKPGEDVVAVEVIEGNGSSSNGSGNGGSRGNHGKGKEHALIYPYLSWAERLDKELDRLYWISQNEPPEKFPLDAYKTFRKDLDALYAKFHQDVWDQDTVGPKGEMYLPIVAMYTLLDEMADKDADLFANLDELHKLEYRKRHRSEFVNNQWGGYTAHTGMRERLQPPPKT